MLDNADNGGDTMRRQQSTPATSNRHISHSQLTSGRQSASQQQINCSASRVSSHQPQSQQIFATTGNQNFFNSLHRQPHHHQATSSNEAITQATNGQPIYQHQHHHQPQQPQIHHYPHPHQHLHPHSHLPPHHPQQQQQQQQQVPITAGPHLQLAAKKSKSCLACADISIKWYIVVIALLGLICALIGTIVGAVHSAGRDYISLTLLLIGVGLVLVAIAWIALRITIKTYKTKSTRHSPSSQSLPSSSSAAAALNASQMARLLVAFYGTHGNGATGANNSPPSNAVTSSQCTLQRSQHINAERIYVMAAAAAAMSRHQQQQQMHQQAPAEASSSSSQQSGLMSSIKRRLPRRLQRLIPSSDSATSTSSSSAQTITTAPATTNNANNETPGANEPAPVAIQNPLAAFLHQYQAASLLPPHHPAFVGAATSSSLPSSSASSHLPPFFGFMPPSDPSFRPPPPSYNAAMQEQRLRAMWQERTTGGYPLQMYNSCMFSPQPLVGAGSVQHPAPAPPPPPPPPSQVTTIENDDATSTQDASLEQSNDSSQVQANLTTTPSGSAGVCQGTLETSTPKSNQPLLASALVTNDIYISSTEHPPPPMPLQGTEKQRQSPSEQAKLELSSQNLPEEPSSASTLAKLRQQQRQSSDQQQTIVNIEFDRTNRLATALPGTPRRHPKRKSEVKFLGYL